MKTYILANGANLTVSEDTLGHLLAHPEVTSEILEAGAKRLAPPNIQTVSNIDLYHVFGNWGVTSLVKVPSATLFGFRRGRLAPSSVIDHPGIPAALLSMVTKPCANGDYALLTAFCSNGSAYTQEPITVDADPRTEEGLKKRSKYTNFWETHALALGCTPIDGEVFNSTWAEIIEKYGNVYHM